MRVPLVLLFLVALLPATVPSAQAHCSLPTSVECAVDWAQSVTDGRMAALVRTIVCAYGVHICDLAVDEIQLLS